MKKKIFSIQKTIDKGFSKINNIIYKEKKLEISNISSYQNPIEHKYCLSIAPMLDITTKHFMAFMRFLTKETLIYSEMINVDQIINSKIDPLNISLDLNPICIQFGGCDPNKCKLSALKVKEKGFSEINLNCGCPSQKVSKGNFGAVLMNNPKLVGNCLKEMNNILFSSIKCRIGLNEYIESYLYNFIEQTKLISGISKYIIHSRIAIMDIDTMKNRSVPPLKYDVVENLKNKYPDLNIVINGGIKTFDVVKHFNQKNIGTMIGREAYDNPWIFRHADSQVFGKKDLNLNRKQIIYEYADYCNSYINNCKDYITSGIVNEFVKPLTNLFSGEKFNKYFIQNLYEITRGSKNPKKKEENKKKYEYISDHLYTVIENYQKKNEEAVLTI